MSQLERILQRQPHIDAAELEDVRARSIARLEAIHHPPSKEAVDPDAPDAPTSVDAEAGWSFDPADPAAEEPVPVAPVAIKVDDVEAATSPIAPSGLWDEAPYEATPIEPGDFEAAGLETETTDVPTTAESATPFPAHDPTTLFPSDDPVATTVEGDTATGTPRRPRRPAVKRRAAKPRVVASAYCPYCAVHLDPPPTSDRRCTRCRQRIIVRSVTGGMLVLLTEAALEVFEAERARDANVERWGRERRVWLRLASEAGAPPSRIERVARAVPSEAGVEAAHAFYDTTVDQSVEEALRRDQWDVAARYRRDQADALHRLAGKPAAPTDDVRDRYRDAALMELRGIGAMTRMAALVGARCCEACRADDGTVVRVSSELRRARLPHAACTKAPCHCRWDLSPRDVRVIQRYLQRTGQLPTADATRS